jgi:ankyrin repeat protein
MNAAGQGKAEILEMLLDAGADINTREKKVQSLSPVNVSLKSFSHLFYTLTHQFSSLLMWQIPATLE